MCLEAIENGVATVSNSKTAKNVSETKRCAKTRYSMKKRMVWVLGNVIHQLIQVWIGIRMYEIWNK